MPSPLLPGVRGNRSNRRVQMEEVEVKDADAGWRNIWRANGHMGNTSNVVKLCGEQMSGYKTTMHRWPEFIILFVHRTTRFNVWEKICLNHKGDIGLFWMSHYILSLLSIFSPTLLPFFLHQKREIHSDSLTFTHEQIFCPAFFFSTKNICHGSTFDFCSAYHRQKVDTQELLCFALFSKIVQLNMVILL